MGPGYLRLFFQFWNEVAPGQPASAAILNSCSAGANLPCFVLLCRSDLHTTIHIQSLIVQDERYLPEERDFLSTVS